MLVSRSLNGQSRHALSPCHLCASPANVSVGCPTLLPYLSLVAVHLLSLLSLFSCFTPYSTAYSHSLLHNPPSYSARTAFRPPHIVKMLSLVTLAISLLFSLAFAQSTDVSWIEPGSGSGEFAYAGSVVDSCPGTTILALQCTSAGSDGAFTDLCGSDGPVRTTFAPRRLTIT